MVATITNFNELLNDSLGPNKEIIHYDVKNLTAPGENYGSLMLALKVDVAVKKTGQIETLHLIAKTAPASEFMQQMFQSRLTFKKELEFYRTVVPTLRKFQEEQGVKHTLDFVANYYGGRLSLNPTLEFDNNAIIILENLKISGFDIEDRTIGFNYEVTKLVLRDLAVFHALPVALKLKHPDLFKEKVLPFLKNATFFTGLGPKPIKALVEDAKAILKENGEFQNDIPLLLKIFERGEVYRKNPTPPKEPYATIAHCDFWVNNTMIKYENGKPSLNKMVDFQMTEYNSPAKDFIFFMFISVQNEVVLKHYDELLKFYYDSFISTLKQHNADVSKFNFKDFLEDMETAAKQNTVLQCIVMLRPIFAPKGDVIHFDKMDENSKLPEAPLVQKKKLFFLMREFSKRNWLYTQEEL